MKRLGVITCSAVLAVGAVAGCGSDDGGSDGGSGDSNNAGGDYCGQVEEMKGSFDALSSQDATLGDMSKASDQVSGIADSAPDEVSSEWKSLDKALSSVVSAFEDLNIAADKPLQGEVAKVAQKNPKKLQKVQGATMDMQSISKDGEAIEKQVKDECDIDLGAEPESKQ